MLGASQAFISYLMQILFAVVMGGFMMTGASRAFVSLARLKEIYDEEPELTYPDVASIDLAASVEFEHVSFQYPNDDKKKFWMTFRLRSNPER